MMVTAHNIVFVMQNVRYVGCHSFFAPTLLKESLSGKKKRSAGKPVSVPSD